LHEILHCIGKEKNCLNQENIIEFAQKAFKIDQDTHDAIYQAVIEKEVSAYTANLYTQYYVFFFKLYLNES